MVRFDAECGRNPRDSQKAIKQQLTTTKEPLGRFQSRIEFVPGSPEVKAALATIYDNRSAIRQIPLATVKSENLISFLQSNEV